MVRVKNTFTYATGDTAKTQTISENGFIRSIVYVLPNFTTAATGVLTIKDTDGNTLYTSAAINDNNLSAPQLVSSLVIPVDYGYTATLTLNDVAGGAHTGYVNLYINELE
jgi:hypothetical protein